MEIAKLIQHQIGNQITVVTTLTDESSTLIYSSPWLLAKAASYFGEERLSGQPLSAHDMSLMWCTA